MQNQVLRLNYYIMIWVVKGLILLISRFNIVSPIIDYLIRGYLANVNLFGIHVLAQIFLGHFRKLLKTVNKRINLHFSKTWGMCPLFQV